MTGGRCQFITYSRMCCENMLTHALQQSPVHVLTRGVCTRSHVEFGHLTRFHTRTNTVRRTHRRHLTRRNICTFANIIGSLHYATRLCTNAHGHTCRATVCVRSRQDLPSFLLGQIERCTVGQLLSIAQQESRSRFLFF